MNYCEWPTLTVGTPCTRCGYVLRMDYKKPPIKRCHGNKPVSASPVPAETTKRSCCGQRQTVIRPAVADDTAVQAEVMSENLLGDWTRDQLEKAGITKEFYIGIKEAVGFAPMCDCDKRVEWLNNAHAWVKRKLSQSQLDASATTPSTLPI